MPHPINMIDIFFESIQPKEVKYGFNIDLLKRIKEDLNISVEELSIKAFNGKTKQIFYNIIHNKRLLSEDQKDGLIKFLNDIKLKLMEEKND